MIVSTDPIADLLSRIRNATLTRQTSVVVPYAKIKYTILRVLVDAGWISDVSLQGTAPRQDILISLKYDEDGKSIIRHIRRVSKPGRRIYVGRSHLPVIENNFGMAVVSTSKGMMTNREARRRGLGGEVMCEVA
jgi:small subunit ribosomal protein S8